MHSTFLFRYIYEEKGKDSRIYGNLIATREERIFHNNKQKTGLAQISSLRKQTNSKLVNLKSQTRYRSDSAIS